MRGTGHFSVDSTAFRSSLPGWAVLALVALAASASTAWAEDLADNPPPAPAFYTQAVVRVTDIKGDSFTFRRDDGQSVCVRLFDADCAAAGPDAGAQAKAVATKLLDGAPFWVFPVGQTKDATPKEVWGDVWTSKGWLSLVLVRSGYAKRRAEPALGSLEPFDKTGTSNKGPAPAAPALLAASCKTASGDALTAEQGSKSLSLRLFDVTCEGKADAAATATRALGSGATWVFPCSPAVGDEVAVRVWTAEGFLSDVLLRGGAAARRETTLKPTIAAKTPDKADKADKAEKTVPEKKPAKDAGDWTLIPISMAKGATSANADNARAIGMAMVGMGGYGGSSSGSTANTSLESQLFKVTGNTWRFQWQAKGVEHANRVTVQVWRYTGNQPDGGSKMPASSILNLTGLTGGQVMNTGPGHFYIKVTSVTEFTPKVEELIVKKDEKAAPAPAK